MRTADVFHAPAVPYNTPIRGRLSTPFTVLFSETRNTLPALISSFFQEYGILVARFARGMSIGSTLNLDKKE